MKPLKPFKHSLLKTSVILILGLTFEQVAYGARCPTYPYTGHNRASHEAMRRSYDTAFKAMDTAMSASIKDATMLLVEGERVKTLQEKSNTESLTQGLANNAKKQLYNEQVNQLNKEIAEVKKEYGSRSVGHNVCVTQEHKKSTFRKQKSLKASMNAMTQNVTARSGHYANRAEALATRLTLHETKYCTKDQALSGLCKKEAPRAGNSLRASTLLQPAKQGDDNDQDKDAFINNIVGLPDDPVPQGMANTALGIAYQDKKRQKDALKSIGIYALKYLQAKHTETHSEADSGHLHDEDEANPKAKKDDKNTGKKGGSGGHAGTMKSEKEASEQANVPSTGDTQIDEVFDSSYSGSLAKDVERHFGNSEDYKSRKRFLVGATEKGVLTELVMGQAMINKLLADRYQDLLIETAVTAGETLATMKYNGMETKVEQARLSAQRQRIRGLAGAEVTPTDGKK